MILQRYILREMLATFLMTFAAISLIIFIGVGIQQYRRLEGLGVLFLLESMPFLFCYAVRFSLPASTLIASVLVFGRLAAENELVAIRASGIHLRHVINPAIALGLWLSFFFLLFNDHVAPIAIQRQRLVIRKGFITGLANPPPLGTSLTLANHRIIYKRYVNGRFEELSILRLDENPQPEGGQTVENAWSQTAEFIEGDGVQPPRFRLQNVTFLRANSREAPRNWSVGRGKEYVHPLNVAELIDETRRFFEMPTPDLMAVLPYVWGERGKDVMAERHQRLAWAFGPFVLILLGAPIGILLRKGSRLAGFGASLPGGALYLLLGVVGQAMSSRDVTALPMLWLWLTDAVFFLLGFLLLWRVYRI